MTCSLITLKIHSLLYVDSVSHTLSCCHRYCTHTNISNCNLIVCLSLFYVTVLLVCLLCFCSKMLWARTDSFSSIDPELVSEWFANLKLRTQSIGSGSFHIFLRLPHSECFYVEEGFYVQCWIIPP